MKDIIIVGGGYVGLSVAVAVKTAAPHLDIELMEAAPEHVWQKDERASAIIAAAINMLKTLELWDDIKDDAQPINDMVVTDSKTGEPVKPVFLTFADRAATNEPFAYMIPNVSMVRALRQKADELGIAIRHGAAVTAFENNGGHARITLAGGEEIATRLVVACDGVRSRLRDMAGIKTVKFDYGQSGIVTTVSHERPHNGRAEEHFLPAGPFAILPLKGNRSSLVWTERTDDAKRLVESDDMVFEVELERRFGHHLGKLSLAGGRRAFPLGLTLSRAFIAPRLALAGDAAHGIHPISGQGLNLGFKDVAALAETIVEADRMGLDIGAMDTLERYQRWRRFDTVRMGMTTDVLNRLFSNDIGPLRVARDFGLGVVDRMPGLKRYFIEEAAGRTMHDKPKLLAGEPL
ncbi:ubiquinone biosynthesis hydroxylase [Martelella sp. AD-3]|uniref:ubiquinone biosynthesis hydroxylase n=1 Tax=Martelella sp. AD-3 TaxID=686597 RepID=UPI0004641E01|nr:ubiquinone biosynthesis hydroxylase [Martelella sp. AD-3]AMM86605.1 2-octaprenyl-6-methoxyphenyl hydroxylase [Martelella sp. AD-3]